MKITALEDLVAARKIIYGAAILDDNEKMIGSMLVGDFDSREDLDAYLKEEPYVTGNVWDKIDVRPCRVPPMFLK
jgi:uncharacterized protein YciI